MVNVVSNGTFVGVEAPKACEKQGFNNGCVIYTMCENDDCESENVQKGGRVSSRMEQSTPTTQNLG